MRRSILAAFVCVAFLAAPTVLAPAPAVAQEAEATGQLYTCPMHPHYIADQDGTCPICGMDLVPVEEADALAPSDDGASPPRAVVTVASEIIQTIGVQIEPVEIALFGGEVRSFAAVSANPRTQAAITSRVEGWIERLAVRAVGDPVEAGDLLFELYSPELVAAQQDYLAARGSSASRARAAARRLEALGMQTATIERLRDSGEAMELVPIFAQASGLVAEIDVVEGSYVASGAGILTLQDYSELWLIASVPEQDLQFLEPGAPARVGFPSADMPDVETTLDYIYPTLDARTRTADVRLVIDNTAGEIRPGAYADIVFQAGRERRLSVSSDAVLRDGSGARVVVSLGGGRFQPRVVETGLESGGRTEILSGLEAGEMIVVSGQFLLDSESSLRETFRRLERQNLPLSLISLSDVELSTIDHVIDAALYVHEALVDGFDVQSDLLQVAVDSALYLEGRYPDTRLARVMEATRPPLAAAGAARTETELHDALASLIAALEPWLLEGRPQRYAELGVVLFEDTASGRRWLQEGERAANPFNAGEAAPIEWPQISDAAATEDAASNDDDEDAARAALTHDH